MPDPFIGLIVHVDKQRFPFLRERFAVYGIPVVL